MKLNRLSFESFLKLKNFIEPVQGKALFKDFKAFLKRLSFEIKIPSSKRLNYKNLFKLFKPFMDFMCKTT